MTSIFSKLSDTLNLLNGQGAQPLPQVSGAVQPPVQSPPSYTKLADTPGFSNAMLRLGATLLAAGDKGMGFGEGLNAGISAYQGEIEKAQAQQAQQASAKLEYQKYLTGVAMDMQKAALEEKKFGLEEKKYGLDAIRQKKQDLLDSITIAEKTGKINADAAAMQKAIVDEQYKVGEGIAAGELASQQINELLKHPGFEAAVGAGIQKSIPFYNAGDITKPGGGFAAGSDAAGFVERLKQLKGGAFLEAYKALKGGGSITEVEGAKAESAVTRMNLATDEKEFATAAKEYQNIINNGIKRAKSKAAEQGITPKGIPVNYKAKYNLD